MEVQKLWLATLKIQFFAYKDKITNLEGSAELDTIVYMDKQFAPVPLISDLYITFDHNINVFESDYETYIREKNRINQSTFLMSRRT